MKRALGQAAPEHPEPPRKTEAAAREAAGERRHALKSSAARVLKPIGAVEPPTRHFPAGGAIDPLGPKTPGLDRRTAQRLAKGETPPEARLDLHGMTAERAHAALISFIQRESAAGARCVLVITGKGRRNERADWVDWRSGETGVLKTMTPEWLRQPPIGALVIGVYEAHQRHGGAGALYVYLRKRRG